MAKKKKSGKKRTTRRRGRSRRVGGFGGGVEMSALGLTLIGALGGRVVTNATADLKFIEDEKIQNGLRIAVKAAGAYFLLSRPSSDMKAAGYGLLGETALDVADSFFPTVFSAKPTVAGIGATVIDLDTMSGYGDMSTDYGVAGYGEDFSVAGAV